MRINLFKKPTTEQLNFFVDCFVEKEVKISESDFYSLLTNPVADSDIIKEFNNLMFIDDKGVYHCLYLYFGDADFGLLVNSDGTNYLRNATCIDKKLLTLK